MRNYVPIRAIRKITKRIRVTNTGSPTAAGVNLLSIDGFRRVETTEAVDLTMLLSRKDPKFRRGPLQNWINFILGTLTSQSESRTYVAWPLTNFLNNQNPKKVNINIWVIEKTRVIV